MTFQTKKDEVKEKWRQLHKEDFNNLYYAITLHQN